MLAVSVCCQLGDRASNMTPNHAHKRLPPKALQRGSVNNNRREEIIRLHDNHAPPSVDGSVKIHPSYTKLISTISGHCTSCSGYQARGDKSKNAPSKILRRQQFADNTKSI